MSSQPLPALSLVEARVLGVLVEKQHTVPDTYPLTLNALAAGCNQKTSRDPVLNATDAEVQTALDHLRSLALVVESSGGRVMRYAHNVERVLQVPPQAVALLAVLLLRGPQTPGELRINCERLHRFADISAVEAFLAELSQRTAVPLVIELARQPGARENRWAHLLSGAPAPDTMSAARMPEEAASDITLDELAALRADLARVAGDLEHLKATVAKLCADLGLSTR